MDLELRVAGDGPAVVFLHGCPSPPFGFDAIASRVAATHTAVQVANPGYAGSPALAPPFAFDDLVAAIEDALRARGVGSAHFVGFSAGVFIAIAIAARRNVVARGLVSLGGLAHMTAEEADGFRGFAGALRSGVDLRAIAAERFLSPRYREAHPERVAEVGDWVRATSAANLANELEAFAQAPSQLDNVRALDIPVLARVGSADQATPPRKSEEIVRAAKRGSLEIVDRAGHALMIEDPEGTTDCVLRAVGARSST